MTRIEAVAIRLHHLFWNNTGDNDDWPITLQCDDELLIEFTDALNELSDAVEEVYPGSSPWPIGAQII